MDGREPGGVYRSVDEAVGVIAGSISYACNGSRPAERDGIRMGGACSMEYIRGEREGRMPDTRRAGLIIKPLSHDSKGPTRYPLTCATGRLSLQSIYWTRLRAVSQRPKVLWTGPVLSARLAPKFSTFLGHASNEYGGAEQAWAAS